MPLSLCWQADDISLGNCTGLRFGTSVPLRLRVASQTSPTRRPVRTTIKNNLVRNNGFRKGRAQCEAEGGSGAASAYASQDDSTPNTGVVLSRPDIGSTVLALARSLTHLPIIVVTFIGGHLAENKKLANCCLARKHRSPASLMFRQN